MPLTCGHDIEVPDNILNFTLLLSVGRLDGPTSPVQAASMFTPGATTSGFKISRERKLGPLDENAATTGEGLIPNLVPRNASVAVAFGFDKAYCLISLPLLSPTATAGIR
ncbi:hypothetical protein LguiB_003578 [Lonicera macranthoides]